MKTLFTGHNGFLGKELIPKLSNEYHISTYDGDILDYKKLNNFVESNAITRVIHAAAKIDINPRLNGTELLLKNIAMVGNVIKLNLPTLTFCSGKVFGHQNAINNAKEHENFIYPADYYGQSKFIIKRLVENIEYFTMIRFFNVFGYHENKQRFIKSNLLRYAHKEPMIVNQDLEFDTFYVEDSLPVIKSWLSEELISKETNLVYQNKLKLTDLCELINKLDKHTVKIIIKENGLAKNYTGNGDKLSDMRYDLLGVQKGLSVVYARIKSDLNSRAKYI